MSLLFYLEEEDNQRDESIDQYKDIFLKNQQKEEKLSNALYIMYLLSGVDKVKATSLVKDILVKCKETIENNYKQIKGKYPNLTGSDAMTICSYTCESFDSNYSPYKVLNKNLVSENRRNGIKIILNYLSILLKSLRKLPKYYPPKNNNYLYRCIGKHINYKIDPFNKKYVPYLPGNLKTFWGFTSTSPNIKTSYNFLDNKINLKSGTIFTLCGDIWGYDITLFNYYKEEEILLEPERKFIISQIYPPVNEIIHVRCEIQNTPIVLNKIRTNIENSSFQNKESINIQKISKKANNSKNKNNLKKSDQIKTINKIKCKEGKNHEFSNINGKCRFCSILGCEKGLSNHEFSNINGKCRFCSILGCEKGLSDHEFSDINGKCRFCSILGCKNGLNTHEFSGINGKCRFCSILGCKNGLSNHEFSDINGKCRFCSILGCKNGLSNHEFSNISGKCIFCKEKGSHY